jgi:AraC-like DNA-binding protein
LIVANIQLFLDYCIRFYDRQFITRSNVNVGVLESFEHILNDYFASDKPQDLGLPTVGFCAEQLHLSANYLGDLIKKETGKSAQEHILLKVIESAKTLLYDGRKSVSQVAYELGYKYPSTLQAI